MRLSSVAICAFALFFVSCAEISKTSQIEDTLVKIRRTGQIEACVVPEPPFVIKNAKTGALSGLDIDTMNLIAEKMNAKVVYHESGASNMVADVESGRCDVLSESSLFATIQRAMTLAFTEPPISYMGLTALARRDDTRFKNVKNVFEFDRPSTTIAVATGTTGDLFVKENFKRARVNRIDVESSDLTRYIVEVSAKRADVAIDGVDDAGYYAAQHPEVVDLFRDRPFSLNPTGWAVRQGDEKWLHFLETALQFLDTQGTLEQLEKKYNAHLIHLIKQYRLQ